MHHAADLLPLTPRNPTARPPAKLTKTETQAQAPRTDKIGRGKIWSHEPVTGSMQFQQAAPLPIGAGRFSPYAPVLPATIRETG